MRKAREPNDKLDRATDRTLHEADRKALRGLCRYSKLERILATPPLQRAFLQTLTQLIIAFASVCSNSSYGLDDVGLLCYYRCHINPHSNEGRHLKVIAKLRLARVSSHASAGSVVRVMSTGRNSITRSSQYAVNNIFIKFVDD